MAAGNRRPGRRGGHSRHRTAAGGRSGGEPSARWRPGADSGQALSARRREVLTALRELGGSAGIAEVAEHTGMHANTVRFHLEALAGQGMIERDTAAPAGPGRPALVFRVRQGMDPTGPRNYRLLAAVLVDQLASEPDAPARAMRAGRAWGSRLVEPPADGELTAQQSVAKMVDLLDDLGFAPERHSSRGWHSVGLRHCPFLDLVGGRTEVICPVHLGLMQGAAETLGASAQVDRLDPFVAPDLCVAHLSGATGKSAD